MLLLYMLTKMKNARGSEKRFALLKDLCRFHFEVAYMARSGGGGEGIYIGYKIVTFVLVFIYKLINISGCVSDFVGRSFVVECNCRKC